ncbi:hypothetical protein Pmani_005904 [Petrolisthes manimaculis]|uniref:Gamma-butyrobetaine dioxygenase n=1 Tax=Petrolisthes manimaculis TaxID=1843537 RepID=A0AAE1QAU5_9EUCA|nr:hypothetical protein Pmani_005904 [Petrolisthes manimaculis]
MGPRLLSLSTSMLSLSTLTSPNVKSVSCRLPVRVVVRREGRRERNTLTVDGQQHRTYYHLSTTTTTVNSIQQQQHLLLQKSSLPTPSIQQQHLLLQNSSLHTPSTQQQHLLLQKSSLHTHSIQQQHLLLQNSSLHTPSTQQQHLLLQKSSLPTPSIGRHFCTSTYSGNAAVIESASVGNGEVRVVWGKSPCSSSSSSGSGGGEECVYPYPWLRDNCQCIQCYDADSYTRIITLEDWHHHDTPQQVKVCNDGVCLEVVWSSGHISTYSATWLYHRRFNSQARSVKKSVLALKKELWGRDFQISRHSFDSIVSDDEALLGFLTSLEKFGVVLVTEAPRKPKAAFHIVNKAGFPKRTHYGLHYPIRRKLGAESLAFTDLKLGMHNDLPYYNYVCGIIFLHCITQFEGSGGENDLADGYHVARYLHQHHPHQYHLLTHTPVYFWNKGVTTVEGEEHQFYKLFNTPIIVEDSITGAVVRVNNSQLRDSHLDVSPDLVTPWYSALRLFNTTLQQHAIRVKLNSGEMLVMDNTRLLHGRTAYDGAIGERYMDQVYLDWDQALSKRRVLQEKLGIHLQ